MEVSFHIGGEDRFKEHLFDWAVFSLDASSPEHKDLARVEFERSFNSFAQQRHFVDSIFEAGPPPFPRQSINPFAWEKHTVPPADGYGVAILRPHTKANQTAKAVVRRQYSYHILPHLAAWLLNSNTSKLSGPHLRHARLALIITERTKLANSNRKHAGRYTEFLTELEKRTSLSQEMRPDGNLTPPSGALYPPRPAWMYGPNSNPPAKCLFPRDMPKVRKEIETPEWWKGEKVSARDFKGSIQWSGDSSCLPANIVRSRWQAKVQRMTAKRDLWTASRAANEKRNQRIRELFNPRGS